MSQELTDFLLARITGRSSPARQIMDLHSDGAHECPAWEPGRVGETYTECSRNCATLRLLALPYADHPDYRDEWKP